MKNVAFRDVLTTFQWVIFLIANCITIPIVIGHIFHFSSGQVIEMMQRTFLVVGISSLLQSIIGHRLSIADGPAGIWLGVFIITGSSLASAAQYQSGLATLEGTMLIGGITLIAAGATGLIIKLQRLFTPIVTGTFLILIAIQLSGTFLKGMLGITSSGDVVKPPLLLVTVPLFLAVLFLSLFGKGFFRTYAVLIGILAGTVIFHLLGWAAGLEGKSQVFSFPRFFSWGTPHLTFGMAVTGIIIGLVLISNLIATITAVNMAVQDSSELERPVLKRSGIIAGINTLLSSLFSVVGNVPLSTTAGFLKMTGRAERLPFICGSILLILISLFPSVSMVFTLIPSPVAYAAILSSFCHMAIIGFNTVLLQKVDQRRATIFGLTIAIGGGSMFIPSSALVELPTLVQSILGNGLLLGFIVAVLMDVFWKEKKESTDH
jgi:xanthine/uracil permease